MRSTQLGLAVVVVIGVTAAPAAAVPWSEPATLSRSHTFVLAPQLGITAAGGALASWRWQDGAGNGSIGGASMTAGARPGAPLPVERELPADVVAGPLPYGRDRVLIARLQDRRRDRLLVQLADMRGRLGTPRLVARGKRIRSVQLAVDEHSMAALAWFDDRGTNDRVHVSLCPAGGSFGRLVRLAGGRIRSVSVAVGPAGHVLVAWDARGTIGTRMKAPRERAFAPVDGLRSEDTFNAALQTAVARDGRAWVAWTAQFRSEGGETGDVFVQTAMRAPGTRRFRPALLLARMPSWATAEGVGLALHGDGDGTLAWASWEGGGPTRQAGVTTILAARVSPAGTPQVSELTRFPTTWLQDSAVVAADRDGDAVVAWTQSIDPMTTQARLYAALRPQRAAGWGAPELVSSGFQPMAPAVAYPPAGPPTVLFANLVDGIRRQVVVQVATRTE